MTNQEFIESIALEGEEWRDVVGYEGFYMVSSFGRVCSMQRTITQRNGISRIVKHSLLQLRVNRNGYVTVYLHKPNHTKNYTVHRLVATSFIPNPENKPCVDHINRDRSCNRVSNLKWCTHSENMRNPLSLPYYQKINLGRKRPYAYRPVVAIRDNQVIYRFEKLTDCTEYGFDYTSVSSICVGRRKSHKGFTFMYLSDYEAQVSMSKNS